MVIHLSYDDIYTNWHDQYFDERKSLLHAPNAPEALNFLSIPGSWCIVPYSVYEHSLLKDELSCYDLAEEVPASICYEITRRNMQTVNTQVLDCFQKELHTFIGESYGIL